MVAKSGMDTEQSWHTIRTGQPGPHNHDKEQPWQHNRDWTAVEVQSRLDRRDRIVMIEQQEKPKWAYKMSEYFCGDCACRQLLIFLFRMVLVSNKIFIFHINFPILIQCDQIVGVPVPAGYYWRHSLSRIFKLLCVECLLLVHSAYC
jgi:hypothetical protein